VGTVIGIGVFLFGLLGKSDELKRAGLAIFFGISLIAIPTYLSGNAASSAIETMPGVSAAAIEAHEDAAVLALILMGFTGVFAWIGLWQFRRVSRPAPWVPWTVLAFSIGTLGLMGRAATIGGEIRHPEILASPDAAAAGGAGFQIRWLTSGAIDNLVTANTWVWPTSETLHFIGLFVLVGIVLLVNLRVLGLMKGLPFAALHRLLPLAVLGFGLNTATGMLFFIAAPEQYTDNPTFYWKIGFILIAGAVLFYHTVFDEVWLLGKGETAPFRARVVSASAILAWLGVIYCGQMLPFLGNAF
jgi:hypothetical protein